MSRSSSISYRPTTKHKRRHHPIQMTKLQVKQDVTDGSIPSAISDTGATSTAGTLHDPFHSTTQPSTKVFLLPTGGTAQATHISQLMLNVRAPANQVDIVPNLTQTLLSGSKFADAGYTAVYDKDEVNFYDSNNININATSILQGYRCPHTGLWRVPLRQLTRNINDDTLILDSPCGTKSRNTRYVVPSTEEISTLLAASSTREQHSILNVYELPSIQQAIRYLHAAAGFPTKRTWMNAIRHGNYDTWPLVTIANVHKHFPQSEETQQGHMRSQRQGVRSTKTTLQAPLTLPSLPHHDIFVKTYDTRDTVYSDQTGKFPHVSSRGNRYQMILYHTDSNSIWVEPTKNRTEGERILARTRALSRMRACGLSPKRQVLDNEASAAFKQAILDSGMTYQLVPPDDHRRNVAEKAIQTWKDHFVAVISGTADKFPLHLWCQLIPHMERQLNLLRQSNANPKVSAYAHLYGPHDYNATPFVPLGMEALVHDKPHRRKTYAQHCSRGWSIGTSPEHYRCWKIWSPTTRSTRIAATVFFKHKYITNPSVTPTDALIAAAANLAHVIKHNAKAQHVGTTNLQDLQRLQQLFSDAMKLPPVPATATAPAVIPAPPPRVSTQTPIPTTSPRPSTSNVVSDDEDSDDETAPPPRVPTRRPIPSASTQRPSTTPPALNTRSRTRSITHDTMLHFLATRHSGITATRATQRRYPPEMLQAVLNDETGELMEYRHLISNPKYRDTWKNAYGKELGRLAQGLPSIVKGTDTIVFIQRAHIPHDLRKDVTYGRIVANFRPEKEDPYRIRLTVGGNRINYPGDCGTPTTDMVTVKILLNSVISTPNAKFMTIDIKDFYLMTPMARPEYMRLKLADIPASIIDLYNLQDLAQDGYVFVRIQKGMYGLPQAGIIAQQLLEQRLQANGYHQSKLNHGFWTHDWRPICFALCVDDFGVKYVGKVHADHLINTLKGHYDISTDWEGRRYLGLTLQWDYHSRTVRLSMPGYCEKAGQRFHHSQPTKPQHQPYPSAPRTYGSKQQLCATADTSPALGKLQKPLYKKSLGRAGGHFFLSENDHYPNNNGAVLTIAQIIKTVMSSAAEAELGALYINAREVIPLRHLLLEMGHPQPPTPIQTDNSTALGVVNNTIQPKRTKAMDMRFHWLRCRTNQKHFRPYWHAGATNLADYVTKHHPAIHHQAVRPLFLTTDPPTLSTLKFSAPRIPRTKLRPPISHPAASAA
eukprot:CCRYP_014425-RA/>CCRYP_014425-RA protein AED:0.04 eAED:0.02 QI:0/0/0/1/1/1/2/0/1218